MLQPKCTALPARFRGLGTDNGGTEERRSSSVEFFLHITLSVHASVCLTVDRNPVNLCDKSLLIPSAACFCI